MARLQILALIACTAATFSPARKGAGRAPSESLLNQSAQQALLRLGPPSGILPSAGGFTVWVWPHESPPRRRISLYQDRVVSLEPASLGHGGLPELELPDSPYLGQPVEELIEDLGQPDQALNYMPGANPMGMPSAQGVLPTLVYGEKWVTLHGGRVRAVGPTPIVKITGPR